MSIFKKRRPKGGALEGTEGRPVARDAAAGALREFVYLDDVSVYSLTSAPDAPPPVSMSEVAESVENEALSGELQSGVPGVVKSRLAAELSSGRSNGLEMQRHFNIQSQFARLHRLYSDSFILVASDAALGDEHFDDLPSALEFLKGHRRAVEASSLQRGALAEVRVALRAHSMFDLSVFIQAAGGLIQRHPGLLPVPDPDAIRQLMDLGEFLNELMEDLVPIEGLATTYKVVQVADDAVWIVDIPALSAIFEGEVCSSPLRVVGVAQQRGFWKDTRQVLHSDAEFDVLGRVSRAGLQTEWSPVKLTDAFDRVIPGVGRSLREALETLKDLAVSEAIDVEDHPLFSAARRTQADLADFHSVDVPDLPNELVKSLISPGPKLEEQLVLLRRVTESFYENHHSLEPNVDVAASIRQRALRAAQESSSEPDPNVERAGGDVSSPALELEFTAMYW